MVGLARGDRVRQPHLPSFGALTNGVRLLPRVVVLVIERAQAPRLGRPAWPQKPEATPFQRLPEEAVQAPEDVGSNRHGDQGNRSIESKRLHFHSADGPEVGSLRNRTCQE